MREIKFRAWDKVHKEWIFVGFHIIGEVTVFEMLKVHKIEQGKSSVESLDDIEITQYTGLKDKNGKEIYEGDIVNNKELDWEVFWNDAVAGYEFASLPNNTNNRISWMPNFDAVAYEFEVIGNIYENPELTKETK